MNDPEIKLQVERDRLRAALVALVGTNNPQTLGDIIYQLSMAQKSNPLLNVGPTVEACRLLIEIR